MGTKREFGIPLTETQIHLLQGIAFLLLLVVTVAGLLPLQRGLDARFLEMKEGVIDMVEDTLGRSITYSSLSPSIFRYLEIRDLRVLDDNRRAMVDLSRVRIRYRLFALFSDAPLDAFTELIVENSVFDLDRDGDRELFELLMTDRGAAMGPGGSGVSLSSLKLRGRNISLRWTAGDQRIQATRLFFSVSPRDGEALEFTGRGDVRVDLAENDESLLTFLEADLRIDADLATSLDGGEGRVRLRGLTSDAFALDPITFQLIAGEDGIVLRKIQDKLPLDVSARFSTSAVSVVMAMDNYALGDHVRLRGSLADFDYVERSRASGRLNVALDADGPRYYGDLSVTLAPGLLPFPAVVDALLEGDGSGARFASLAVDSEFGEFLFDGDIDFDSLLPSGDLRIRNMQTLTQDRLAGLLRFRRTANGLSITSPLVRVGRVSLAGIEATLGLGDAAADFRLSTTFAGADWDNSLSVEGAATWADGPRVVLTADASDVPVERLFRVYDSSNPVLEAALSGFAVDTSIAVTTDLSSFEFRSDRVTITEPEFPGNRISFTLAGSDTSIAFTGVEILRDEYRLAGDFSGIFNPDGRIDFDVDASLQGIPYVLSGMFVPDQVLVASGDYGVEVSALTSGGSWIFQVESRDLPLPLGDGSVWANLDLRGRYTDPENWDVQVFQSGLANLPIPTVENSVSFTATADPNEIRVLDIRYRDAVGDLTGNGYLSRNGDLSTGWLQLVNDSGTERYSLSLDALQDRYDVVAEFSGASLTRVEGSPLQGGVGGSLVVRGTAEGPSATLQVTAETAKFNNDPINFDLVAAANSERIDLERLEVRYFTNTLANGRGSANLENGEFSFLADYDGEVSGKDLGALVTLEGNAPPDDRPLTGDLQISAARYGGEALDSWLLRFQEEEDLIRISGGPRQAFSGAFHQSGDFALRIDDSFPVSLSAVGRLSDGTIDGDVTLNSLDLSVLQTVMNMPLFNLTSGNARGQISVQGPVNDPEFFGGLTLENSRAESLIFGSELGPMVAPVRIEGKEIRLDDVWLPAANGGGYADVLLVMDHWIPQAFDIELTAAEAPGLPITYGQGSLWLEGWVTGTFRFGGDINVTRISGDLVLSRAIITLGERETKGSTFETFVELDLAMTAGRQVDFLWPNRNFPILRSTMSPGGDVRISADTAVGQYLIRGDLDLKGGEIYYVERNFYLKEGRLSFDENQDKMDPRFSTRAELREVGDDGEPLEIYFIIDDKPLSQFSPRFESDPPMADVDILALLGQNIYTEFLGQDVSLSSALLLTSDILGQFGILRTFEQRVREVFQLDMFSIRTQLLENILKDKVLSAGSDEAELGFGQYLDNTTVFVGKNLGDDIFLETLVSFRAVDEALAVARSLEDFQVNAEINLEWETPLFDLELSFLPDFADPFASLKNTSLGISWGFTY
jgi:translocation and assembly module TamB